MRKSFLTVVTFVLLLAMLAVPILGGTLNVSADTSETTAPANPTFDEVDEFRIISPNYQSNWAGSSIISLSYGKWVATDGSYNGAMQWGAGYSNATLSADGILSFPASATPGLKFMPYQSFNVKAGPVRITFDIKIDADTPTVTYEGNRTWLFYIRDGKLYHTSNKWWKADENKVLVDELAEGWNTIEMIFMPTVSGGYISTDSADTLAENHLYMRAYPSGSIDSSTALTPTYLTENYFKTSLAPNKNEAEDMKHFVSAIGGSAAFKLADKDSTDGKTDVLQIRSATAANLELYIDKPIASFLGYEALNQSVNYGEEITIPSAEGVVAWTIDGAAYYFSGDKYKLDASTSFSPILSSGFLVSNGHNSADSWATGKPAATGWGTVYHSADGTSPILQWYGTENLTDGTASGWVYDATEKSVTIYKGEYNNISIYPKKATVKDFSFSGANCIVTSFDLKYTSGGGTSITAAGKTISVSNTGVVKVNDVEAATLNEGWNNFQIYYIPTAFDTDGTTPTAYKIYVGINQAALGAYITMTDLVTLPNYDWEHGALEGGDNLAIVFSASTATIPLGFRNITNNRLDATDLNNVYIESLDEMYTTLPSESITLPTFEDAVFWSDGTDMYAPDTEYTPTASFVTLTPVTAAEVALEQLTTLTTTLTNATTIAEKVAALDALTAALQTPGLDTADARYTAAVEAKEAAVTAIKNSIKNALPEEGTTPTDGNAWYTALAGAIADYNTAKAYMNMGIMETLDLAIEAYNAFVDEVNADVIEAVTVAVVVTVDRLPNTEIVAILADIKSKVDDGHQPG